MSEEDMLLIARGLVLGVCLLLLLLAGAALALILLLAALT